MSKYEKKKVTEKVKPRKNYDKIPLKKPSKQMTPKEDNNKKAKSSKVKATSLLRVKGFVISVSILVVFLASYLVIYLLHPIGVLEYTANYLSTIGSGKYPISLDGGDILQVDEQHNTYFVLSKTNISVYSNAGKEVFTSQHGFLQPVLKTSDVRFLIYDQGGKGLKIFNNSKSVASKKYDNEIITADIGKNGTYAVATRADGYQSVVYVTNKNEKKLYEWYCVNETVNAVALSDNGETLVTASLKVDNGKFKSTVNVLKYNSATPAFSFEFDDVILSIEACGNNKAVIAFSDKLVFLNLKNGNTTATDSNYDINVFKRFGNFILTSSSLTANKLETQITLYKFSGEIIDSFSYSAAVDDISYSKGKYFIISDSKVYKIENDGKVLTNKECSFDIKKIVALSGDSVVGVGYSKIEKYSLTGG